MKNTWTIAWRDFRTTFTSPIAYAVLAGFMLILGWMFFFTLEYYAQQNAQYQQYNMGKSMSLTEGVIRPLYANMNVILLFTVPFITMRLFAEERKNQTIQLLFTAPLKLHEIVLGKFLCAAFFVFTLIVLTGIYPIVLSFATQPDYGAILTCALGTFLLGSSLAALGVFFSAMTENQIVAGFSTFAASLFLWLINWAGNSSNSVLGDVLGQMSLVQHFTNFSKGVINTHDLVFYGSFLFLSLFLTHRVLDSYRWR